MPMIRLPRQTSSPALAPGARRSGPAGESRCNPRSRRTAAEVTPQYGDRGRTSREGQQGGAQPLSIEQRDGEVTGQKAEEQTGQEFQGEQDVPLAHHPDAEQGGERYEGSDYEGDRQGRAELRARAVLVYERQGRTADPCGGPHDPRGHASKKLGPVPSLEVRTDGAHDHAGQDQDPEGRPQRT